ncbi:MAG: 30S ribosomal protein S17 [Candidatus Vogelbacteria bacterium]|nr:30S ribosomal protein S17 [Candidatus Vogelbacteria bacterium]
MENKVTKEKTKGTVLEGVVVSDKMAKTAVVSVDRFVKHAKYQKYFKISKKYKAENPDNMYKVGDKVKMQSCRPLSKDKHFVIVEKTGKGYVESNIVGDEAGDEVEQTTAYSQLPTA